MDNQRPILWIALAVLLWLNVDAWQKQFAPPAPAATATTAAPTTSTAPPLAPADALPPLPAAGETPTSPAATPDSAAPEAPQQPATDRKIRVVTDVLDIDISTRGGELQRADLLKYPKVKNEPNNPVRLFTTKPGQLFVARSGLQSDPNLPQPGNSAVFEAGADEYRWKPGEQQLEVPLTWTDGQGLKVVKTYIFRPGSYRIDLRYDVTNDSASDWKAASYVQLVRHYEPVSRSYFNVESYSNRGPVIFDTTYRQLDIEDEEDNQYSTKAVDGWIGAIQHHFVAAAVPPKQTPYEFQLSTTPAKDYTLFYRGPVTPVAAGSSHTFKETLFVGPKLQEQLIEIHEELKLTADYGKLTLIARPLFLLLQYVYDWVGNWGWSIVIVTLLIKLAFYRLTAASGRSMAKMRNLGPRIKALQERYKDDREQLGRQMMDIYKREKVNPLAGCLPMLIQIPFFFAYYWVLLESVEMRQAPFLGWITDLSARDPFFILPVLMCVAMVVQFRLQPMPSTDPLQAKIFGFMPVVMGVTMAWFPAGLVLYWLTNTVLSIAQQWRINKLVAAEDKKA
jgi:YidC/Oxa1 family membrane protein insertase